MLTFHYLQCMMLGASCQCDKIQNNLGEGPQACLWRIILITLIEVERLPTVSDTHSLVGILDCVNRKGK